MDDKVIQLFELGDVLDYGDVAERLDVDLETAVSICDRLEEQGVIMADTDRATAFEPDAICDVCGIKGAYDFMGDYFCAQCVDDEQGQQSPEDMALVERMRSVQYETLSDSQSGRRHGDTLT